MPDRGHVRADLVRAPGLEPDAEEGRPRVGLDDLEMRARLARAVAAHRHQLAVVAVAADRRVDRARPGVRAPLHERQVLALELAGPDQALERAVHGIGLRHDHQAGGVPVEAVHYPGAPGLGAARGAAGERLRKGAGRVAGRRVYDHPGGLVDDQQVVILEHDLIGHTLAGARIGRVERAGEHDAHAGAGRQGVPLHARGAVHGHRPGVDQPLRGRARADGLDAPEEDVQALARGLGRDDEIERIAQRAPSMT
jgi:hypothetical protein